MRLLLLALALLAALPADAQYIQIDNFTVTDINSTASTLIGRARDGSASLDPSRWEAGTVSALVGIPDSITFSPQAISGGGAIIVGTDFSRTPDVVGTLIGNGFTVISPPGVDDFRVETISTDGSLVAGSYEREVAGTTNRPPQAAVLSLETGVITVLAMPDGHNRADRSAVFATSLDGRVRAGFRRAPGVNTVAMRWDVGTPSEPPLAKIDGREPFNAQAVAVSADGTVVLGFNNRSIAGSSSLAEEVWLWSGSTVTQLPTYPGYDASAPGGQWEPYALSADGTVVLARCGGGSAAPCLWDAQNGWRFIDALIEETGASTSSFSFGDAYLSQDGQVVVGTARNRDTGVNLSYRYGVTDTRIRVTTNGDQADPSPNDDECDVSAMAGVQCTLRAAIQTANARTGPDEILFEIEGNSPHTITVRSALPSLTAPTIFDGTTQPGYTDRPLVVVRGTGVSGDGLVLDQAESAVLGLAVGGFGGAGIRLTGAGGSRVEGSYVGVGADGATALANGLGIVVDGSPNHTVGGDEAGQGNVIAGNAGPGILVTGPASTGIVLAGNRIGMNAAGTAAVPNEAEGVRIERAPGVRVGGSDEAARNLIGGNATHGVYVVGAEADGVQVLGNWIGVGADGSMALPNGTDATARDGHHGVALISVPNAVVGGETGSPGAAPGNVIAASAAHGVYVTGTPDAPASGAQVLGNLVGTDRAGSTALVGGEVAVYVAASAPDAQIGRAGAGNVIVAGREGDGGQKSGVWLIDLGAAGAPDGGTVAANTVGLDATGNTVLGNLATGIGVLTEQNDGGVERVVVGGDDAAAGNRVAGPGFAIGVFGPGSSGTVIASNVAGLRANGQLALSERPVAGIWVSGANGTQVVSNTVGGYVFGLLAEADEVGVFGNRIGTNPAGTQARPNTVGVYVPGEVPDGPEVGNGVVIGAEGAGNVLSGNERGGVWIGGVGLAIGQDGGLRQPGAALHGAPDLRPAAQRLAATAPVRDALFTDTFDASAHRFAGSANPDGVVVAYNRVGVDQSGRSELGNGRSGNEEEAFPGIWVRDGRDARLLANVVSGNGIGVLILGYVEDEEPVGNPRAVTIAGSGIGVGSDFATAIPNQFAGVAALGSASNRLVAAPLADGGQAVGNVVAFNGGRGVLIRPFESERGNQVRATAFLRNQGPSIELLNGELEYPAVAPQPPTIYTAFRNPSDAGVTIRAAVGASGEADVFLSTRCSNGEAEGSVISTLPVSAGAVTVPLEALPADVSLFEWYLALNVTEAGATGTTSALSRCTRVALADNTAEVPIAPGETGPVFDDDGLQLDVTSNTSSLVAQSLTVTDSDGTTESAKIDGAQADGGTLYVSAYGEGVLPPLSPVEGSAVSPSGMTVTPSGVSTNRHWTLVADGLERITYNACLNVTGLRGVTDPTQLVVVQRPDARTPWTPFPTTLEGTRLCAEGFTAWGDLGVGADTLINPVSNEDRLTQTLPDAFALGAYPNPSAGRTTIEVALPQAAEVRAEVVDLLGRRVVTLHDGPLAAGTHALRLDAARLPAGVYVVRAATPTASLTRRLTVVR
ncbi:MAG: T9SS type A sorting domain-containing protein [Bacteroidota bacterium]